MRLNKTDFLRKAQHPLLMGMASLPVTMLLFLSAAPEWFSWCWCYPAGYVLCAWACLLLPGKKRLLGAAAAAVLTAAVTMLLPWRMHFLLLLLPVMYIALLLWTLPIAGWPYNRELAVGWHAAGVVTHVLLQLLTNGAKMTGSSLYDPARLPLLISFLAYMVLVLLALNRASLDSAAQSRRKVPLLMRRQNMILTMALLLLGVLLSGIPAIGAALGVVWDYILQGIALLASLLPALMPQNSSGGGGGSGGMPDMGLGEANPPSKLAQVLEKIMGILALVIIVAALILLLRAAGKKLWKLFKLLWSRMLQYGSAASEDYEDEITSTRDEADTEREGLLARLRRSAPGEEKGGTPTEQVRRRYKRLKQKHRDWSNASTARETIPAEAAALYERARYAGAPLTEEDANRFREGTRRM